MTISGHENQVIWKWTNNLHIDLVRHTVAGAIALVEFAETAAASAANKPAARVHSSAAASSAATSSAAASDTRPHSPVHHPAATHTSSYHHAAANLMALRTASLLEAEKNARSVTVPVPPHSVHNRNAAAVGGNPFFGSFTLINKNSQLYYHSAHFAGNPTDEHTEPQYFKWINAQIESLPLRHIRDRYAIILEINQNNTPCSQVKCRPAILSMVETRTVSEFKFEILVFRMSADNIYETSPPGVRPTALEIADGQRSVQHLSVFESMCIHKFPPPQGRTFKPRIREQSSAEKEEKNNL